MNNFDKTLKMSGRLNLSGASYPFLILFSWEILRSFFFSCLFPICWKLVGGIGSFSFTAKHKAEERLKLTLGDQTGREICFLPPLCLQHLPPQLRLKSDMLPHCKGPTGNWVWACGCGGEKVGFISLKDSGIGCVRARHLSSSLRNHAHRSTALSVDWNKCSSRFLCGKVLSLKNSFMATD